MKATTVARGRYTSVQPCVQSDRQAPVAVGPRRHPRRGVHSQSWGGPVTAVFVTLGGKPSIWVSPYKLTVTVR